jgi:hypothetical protein
VIRGKPLFRANTRQSTRLRQACFSHDSGRLFRPAASDAKGTPWSYALRTRLATDGSQHACCVTPRMMLQVAKRDPNERSVRTLKSSYSARLQPKRASANLRSFPMQTPRSLGRCKGCLHRHVPVAEGSVMSCHGPVISLLTGTTAPNRDDLSAHESSVGQTLNGRAAGSTLCKGVINLQRLVGSFHNSAPSCWPALGNLKLAML